MVEHIHVHGGEYHYGCSGGKQHGTEQLFPSPPGHVRQCFRGAWSDYDHLGPVRKHNMGYFPPRVIGKEIRLSPDPFPGQGGQNHRAYEPLSVGGQHDFNFTSGLHQGPDDFRGLVGGNASRYSQDDFFLLFPIRHGLIRIRLRSPGRIPAPGKAGLRRDQIPEERLR